jgi:hypothetical protein
MEACNSVSLSGWKDEFANLRTLRDALRHVFEKRV